MSLTQIIANTAVTVDIILPCYALSLTAPSTHIALIRRGRGSAVGEWALPGGRLNEDDPSLVFAAARELREETGVDLPLDAFYQLHTFGDMGRDPRGRYVSVLFLAHQSLPGSQLPLQASDDASEAGWFSISELPKLAFDHRQMVSLGARYLSLNNVPLQPSLFQKS